MGFPPRGFSGKTVSRARIFDLYAIPLERENGSPATRYREEDLMLPRGIKRSRVCPSPFRPGDDGDVRLSWKIFPLIARSSLAANETAGFLYHRLEHRG